MPSVKAQILKDVAQHDRVVTGKLPVEQVIDDTRDIGGTALLMVEVVGMLPDIDNEVRSALAAPFPVLDLQRHGGPARR
jgi:hypothetical protein